MCRVREVLRRGEHTPVGLPWAPAPSHGGPQAPGESLTEPRIRSSCPVSSLCLVTFLISRDTAGQSPKYLCKIGMGSGSRQVYIQILTTQ